jgi:nitrogen fixation-related uncharacterized protein
VKNLVLLMCISLVLGAVIYISLFFLKGENQNQDSSKKDKHVVSVAAHSNEEVKTYHEPTGFVGDNESPKGVEQGVTLVEETQASSQRAFVKSLDSSGIQHYQGYLGDRFGLPLAAVKEEQLSMAIRSLTDSELTQLIAEITRDENLVKDHQVQMQEIMSVQNENSRRSLIIQHKSRVAYRIIDVMRESGIYVAPQKNEEIDK